MPTSPTAGKRLFQQLMQGASSSTSSILQQATSPGQALQQAAPQQTASDVPQAVPAQQAAAPQLSDAEKLALFESVLDEVEATQPPQEPVAPAPTAAEFVEELPDAYTDATAFAADAYQSELDATASFAQSVPMAVQEPTEEEQLTAQQTGGVRKESLEGARSGTVVEAAPSSAGVEVERSAEIPPEVESYIEEVIDHAEQQPQEIVIAEQVAPEPKAAPVSRTVKVLPLTKAQAELAKRKGPNFSVRWLYEFSDKIAKIFAGSVSYRPE